MSGKHSKIFVSIFIVVMLVALNQTPAVETDNLSSDMTISEIAGIAYSYGQRTYQESGEVSYTTNATIQESYSASNTGITNMSLITDITFDNFYYELQFTNSSSVSNTTSNTWVDQTGLEDVINYINSSVPLKFNSSDVEDGRSKMNINVTEAYSLVEGSVITIDGQFVGNYPQNTTFIEFLDKDQAEIIKRTMLILPRVLIVDLITEVHEVYYNQTEIAFAYLGYYNEYSMSYNISASAYQVNITDGENFGVSIGMFDRIDAEYEESIISVLFYSIFAATFTEIQFTDDGQTGNGTLVSDNGYIIPFSLFPVVYSAQGTQVEAGYRHVSSSIVSTYQSIVAGFLSRAEDASDNLNETSLSARLAVWGLSTSTTMVAFNDGNNNGRLDLAVNNEGLYVKSSDHVEALGLAEAYETNVTNAYYSSHYYNQSAEYLGLGVSVEETNVNNTNFVYNTASYGFGDVNSDVTSTFVWNEPIERADGNVEFNFGMDYTNFPVTWVNMTDGSSTTDAEDISYHYKVIVDPATGQARVSPTWIYGGITDPGLKRKAEDLSLALLVRSEFFGLQATYSATESSDPVNSTRSTSFSRLFVQFGGKPTTEIDTTGPKQFYLSGGGNYTANFDAIRLVTVAGSFSASQVSPFSSQSESSASNSATGSLIQKLDVNFIYTLDLLVVSYPTWSGNNITHDPDYNISYEANPVDDTSDDTTGETNPDDSTNTPSTLSDTPDTSTNNGGNDPTDSDLPGFGLALSIFGMIAVILVKRR